LRLAEKPRDVRHGLVTRRQSLELVSLRGMHNEDAKPSCQVTRACRRRFRMSAW
jgi:hypothetical protein